MDHASFPTGVPLIGALLCCTLPADRPSAVCGYLSCFRSRPIPDISEAHGPTVRNAETSLQSTSRKLLHVVLQATITSFLCQHSQSASWVVRAAITSWRKLPGQHYEGSTGMGFEACLCIGEELQKGPIQTSLKSISQHTKITCDVMPCATWPHVRVGVPDLWFTQEHSP